MNQFALLDQRVDRRRRDLQQRGDFMHREHAIDDAKPALTFLDPIWTLAGGIRRIRANESARWPRANRMKTHWLDASGTPETNAWFASEARGRAFESRRDRSVSCAVAGEFLVFALLDNRHALQSYRNRMLSS